MAFAPTRRALVAPTRVALTSYSSGGYGSLPGALKRDDTMMNTNIALETERGVKVSSVFQEQSTAVYEVWGAAAWTYFRPEKVNIDVVPPPEAKHYQRLTRRPWDITTAEFVELSYRKKTVMLIYYGMMILFIHFIMPQEKQYAKNVWYSDGIHAMLPKNKPHMFQ